MEIYSLEEEIEKADFRKPHCFLLGAGASYAAFPNGDNNGRILPLMCNFVGILKLEPFLKKSGIEPPYDDFEAIYAKLVAKEENFDISKEIDEIIYDYFKGMELPDVPTLYDHLVLSLREKDVIATFNWDPFLFQCIGNSIIVNECLNFLILEEYDAGKNSFVIRHRDVRFDLLEKYGFSGSIGKFDGNHKTLTTHHADFLERRYVFIVFVERLFPFCLNNLF